MINPNETPRFDAFYDYVYKHKKATYTFQYANGTSEDVVYFTDYETENLLEEDDPNYEEYWGIAFRRITTDDCFEITYHNLPEAVYCNGKRVI